jgi:hypothetical protein
MSYIYIWLSHFIPHFRGLFASFRAFKASAHSSCSWFFVGEIWGWMMFLGGNGWKKKKTIKIVKNVFFFLTPIGPIASIGHRNAVFIENLSCNKHQHAGSASTKKRMSQQGRQGQQGQFAGSTLAPSRNQEVVCGDVTMKRLARDRSAHISSTKARLGVSWATQSLGCGLGNAHGHSRYWRF